MSQNNREEELKNPKKRSSWLMSGAVLTGSTALLLATASQFHLPMEPIFVILGIDALMDMARTTVNVVGNCLASVVIAKWEGEFGTEAASEVVLEGAEA